MRAWEVLDVDEWPSALPELRGQRVKKWVVDPDGVYWLRKERRHSRACEPAIEAAMLRLAEYVGVIAAHGSACTWTDDEGSIQHGLAVRSFMERGREEFSSGAVLLERQDVAYDPSAKWKHTLQRVLEVLREQERLGGAKIVEQFALMLAFDAWIGNGDRHQENWGVISATSAAPRLAPMYDPAACVGAELLDNHRLLDVTCNDANIAGYARKCPSGFGDGQRGVRLANVVNGLAEWAEWTDNVHDWLARFHGAMDTFRAFLTTVPTSWLPQPRKDLALRLLQHRLVWLAGQTARR